MILTFYSNFINHHQVHVADEFYRLLGSDFHFVSTMSIPRWIIESGYPDYNDRPYIVKAYENDKELSKAKELSSISDVVIVGSAPRIFYVNRLRKNQMVFLCNERWFKSFQKGYLNPQLWISWYKNYVRYRQNRYYMLCASAFTANDVSFIGAFPGKCFKWGYFTKIPSIDIELYHNRKRAIKEIRILWCARFLKLKRPDMVIKLAYFLKLKGYNFHIDMLGTGEQTPQIVRMIERYQVGDRVFLLGNKPNEEVLEIMRRSHIFIFTSNRQEGWGAVLNEAMGAGCAVVASDKIGSAPFLVNNNENGLLFHSGNQDDLNRAVEFLFKNPENIYSYGKNAYNTMQSVWSPQNAVCNFMKLVSNLMRGEDSKIEDGPCSKAYKL